MALTKQSIVAVLSVGAQVQHRVHVFSAIAFAIRRCAVIWLARKHLVVTLLAIEEIFKVVAKEI
jgi:hypothetical protein